jgi:tetratricopeptide (TPR) repeat protein
MNQPGRNDPCPCGSGKKYKKCCLPREEAARSAARPPGGDENAGEPYVAELRPELDEQVDAVLERLELGAGRAVEPEIKALLEKYPGYHSTQFAMGVYLATVRQDYAGSIPYFERAVEIFPPFPEAHFNLGNSARKTGDIPKAVRAYRAAMRYSPAGDRVAALARNELEVTTKIVLKGTSFPNLDAYLANAKLFDEAFACLTKQDYEQAACLFNQVLAEFPGHVQSYGNLGLAYAGLGRRAAALECLDQALALDPHYEPAQINRPGIELMREGEPFRPAGIREVNFYSEKLEREKST